MYEFFFLFLVIGLHLSGLRKKCECFLWFSEKSNDPWGKGFDCQSIIFQVPAVIFSFGIRETYCSRGWWNWISCFWIAELKNCKLIDENLLWSFVNLNQFPSGFSSSESKNPFPLYLEISNWASFQRYPLEGMALSNFKIFSKIVFSAFTRWHNHSKELLKYKSFWNYYLGFLLIWHWTLFF